MTDSSEPANRHVRSILDLLESKYKPLHPDARFDAYQSSRWSIRVRVIDPDVAGLGYNERDQPIFDIFEALPDDTFQRLSLLFIITPDEVEESGANWEFEAGLAANLKRRKARADSATKKAGNAKGRAEKARPE